MSLMRQLWLAVVLSTVVAFAGSLLISMWSARDYLVQQLERKNSDNAGSLALSMTQQEKDAVMIDLQVAALFDTGYYQSITVADTAGRVIAARVQDRSEARVPGWFVELFPIPSKPGIAQISDGWKQYGTVKVVSHNQFAYQALWAQTARLLIWFGVGGGVVGLLGMFVVHGIGRSLGAVVGQAGAIGERRFVTIPEPRIPELRALARAMNGMVERIRQMFDEEAGHLDELRRRVNFDPLTGLPNRDYFMAYLREQLSGAEAAQGGVLAVMRLPDLDEVNRTFGRDGTDALLTEVGRFYLELAKERQGALAGRIKAGDVALLLPGESDAGGVGADLAKRLGDQLLAHWRAMPDLYHLGIVRFGRGEALGDVLSRADQALAVAESKDADAWHAIDGEGQAQVMPGEEWRTLLTQAVSAGRMELAYYPVVRLQGGAVHQEGVIRLQPASGGPSMTAGDFMPIAAHLHLTAPLDFEVIKLALRHLAAIEDDVAVNLAAETIGDWAFRNDLWILLRSRPELCRRLWVEVPEYGALKHFDAFRDLCRNLKSLGCRVGIEHFGLHLSESSRFTQLGLDYVKIDSCLVTGIEANAGNQEFVGRFCRVAHGVGIIVIAVGVRTEAELAALAALGVDGATGPGIGK